jgi:hypothetical protein
MHTMMMKNDRMDRIEKTVICAVRVARSLLDKVIGKLIQTKDSKKVKYFKIYIADNNPALCAAFRSSSIAGGASRMHFWIKGSFFFTDSSMFSIELPCTTIAPEGKMIVFISHFTSLLEPGPPSTSGSKVCDWDPVLTSNHTSPGYSSGSKIAQAEGSNLALTRFSSSNKSTTERFPTGAAFVRATKLRILYGVNGFRCLELGDSGTEVVGSRVCKRAIASA